MIVNDDSSIISKWCSKLLCHLLNDISIIIYDNNMFTMQATGWTPNSSYFPWTNFISPLPFSTKWKMCGGNAAILIWVHLASFFEFIAKQRQSCLIWSKLHYPNFSFQTFFNLKFFQPQGEIYLSYGMACLNMTMTCVETHR
jgi:hypothetical protein